MSLASAWLLAAAALAYAAGSAVTDRADLSVEISARPAAELGSSVRVAVTVRNFGPSDVPDARVVMPEAGGTSTWRLGAIAAGTRRTIPIDYLSHSPGSHLIKAAVSSTVTDPDPANDAAERQIIIYVLGLRDLRTSAPRPTAGRAFSASQTLVRSDTGEPLRARSLACPAAVAVVPRGAGHPYLRGRPSLRGSHLGCTWQVPPGTSGRYLRMMLVASTHRGGMQTKYPFVRRIP